MKSITKTVFLFLTCLFVFSSCCEKQNSDEPKQITITYERAAQLQKNYIETRANFLNAYLDSSNHFEKDKRKGLTANGEESKIIEDTRDVTFSIEDLKQYIAYVEKIAKEKDLKGLGLRFYFGAYSKNDTTPNIKYPGYTTLFFMPTHQVESKNNNANKFFDHHEDEVIEGANPGNLGQAGKPPKDLN